MGHFAGRAVGELPPCCRSCELYEKEAGQCLLLAHPTEENRRHLLTMPCRVEKLLEQRFRSHGPDVGRDALVSWLDPDWDPTALRTSYGSAPVDARLWLTSWPYLYLGRNAVRRRYRNAREQPWSEPPAPDSTEEDPTLPGRVLRALDGVRRVDAVGYAMVVEMMRGEFEPAAWRASLDVSDATVTDRKYLAIYRYSVYFFDVLRELEPKQRAALGARRFTPGDPNDGDALALVRSNLRRPNLTLNDFRELYRAGAHASLGVLARSDALGEESMKRYEGTFRRVLRIEAPR
ncbi:MAG: hypothetical protein JST00_20520 [Deltaproteobacteria bacterium]|nr:hypothetical protein [Deltaproteobacteria bacterium]